MDNTDNTAAKEDTVMYDNLNAGVATDADAPSAGPCTTPASDSLVITRCDDSRGAIHFTVNSLSLLPPKPPMHCSYSSFSSGVMTMPRSSMKITAPTNRTVPMTSAPQLPRGADGRFSALQKGKGKLKRKLTTESSPPSLPSPTSQPVEGSSSRPKETAAVRNACYDSNFIDVQHRLQIVEKDLQDSRASIRLLEAKFTATPISPVQPTTQPSVPPWSHPSTSLSAMASTSAVVTRPALLDRISDHPRTQSTLPGSHKRPRMSQPQVGMILDPESAILTAPACWQFPSATAPVVRIISRWRELFAKLDNSRLLPMPISVQAVAQHRSSPDDDPSRDILFFDSGGLNLFMDL
ncbi:hypothetical protein F5880DRAFT_1619454 [Lentinula raphanica]|nr:hypothetical protein F5880DRAFT_1619454 [Lentinula raphanica]